MAGQTDSAAYTPRQGYESLDHKLAANSRLVYPEVYASPEWGEVRVVMRQLQEAERVLRVISGWNTDLVDTATAIQPALAYFANRDLEAKLDAAS